MIEVVFVDKEKTILILFEFYSDFNISNRNRGHTQ
jgi:hypothetical protein